MAPDRISYLLLLALGVSGLGPGCYEALAGSDKAASGTFALITCCREVQFQAVIFSVVTALKLVSFAGRTFRCLLLRGPSALPSGAAHSRLAILSGKRV
jgi:hypothetical protein